jgi:hypothetical protein
MFFSAPLMGIFEPEAGTGGVEAASKAGLKPVSLIEPNPSLVLHPSPDTILGLKAVSTCWVG